MNNELSEILTECRWRDRELTHTIEPRARIAMAIDNRDWCKAHTNEVLRQYQDKTQEYWRTYALWFGEAPHENPTEHELDDQTREAGRYRNGQVAFLVGEVICAGGLAAMYFKFGLLLSIVIGSGLALLMAAVAATVVSPWVLRDGAAIQPSKQKQRITRGLVRLGGLWLIACAAALAIIRAQDTSMGAFLFWVITTVLTVVSPICSGLCRHGAELLSWSRRLCRDLSSIRSLLRELDRLETCSQRSIPPPGPGLGPVAQSRNIPLPSRKANGVGATALLAVVFCAVPAMCRAADLPVYVYVDVSPSARAGDVARVLNDFAQRLNGYTGADALAISVTPFYESAFMATPFVQVRIPGNSPDACPLPKPELVYVSHTYDKARSRQCDEISARQRSTEISKLTAAVDRLSGLKLPGHCTAVNAIVRRAARESPKGIAVVVTDGEESCSSRDLPTKLSVQNQTFVVPVGSRQHAVEDVFEGIQTKLARTMPCVQVIESYRLEVVMNSIAHPEYRIAARH